MSDQVPDRVVRLVLVKSSGEVVGELDTFAVATPWLQEVAEIVTGVADHFKLEVTILRLITTRVEGSTCLATYLAEISDETKLDGIILHASNTALPDSSKRLAYAAVGGPAADLEWATELLQKHGEIVCSKQQIRTWNLSSIWRLDTEHKCYWLKVVPAFFTHEPKVIEQLDDSRLPTLVGASGNRFLMENISGVDLYDARVDQMQVMITHLVKLQGQQVDHAEELVELGLQDWRTSAMFPKLKEVVNRNLDAFNSDEQLRLQSLLSGLPGRMAALDNSGIPYTLVHGDFHPGNWRGEGSQLRILDWGDCFVGHPLLDFPGLLDRVEAPLRPGLKMHWCEQWQQYYPDAKLDIASTLIEPIAALRHAWVYQMFLDNIEPSEHVYHLTDPIDCISRALVLAAAER